MEATGEPIRVVGIFPLSGFIAADGEEMRNGLVMALDEINEMGGLLGSPLEYIEIDDVNSFTADEISTAFQRAVEVEEPDVIISGYHLSTAPEFDIVAEAEKLYYNVNTQQAWIDRYQSDPEKYWGIFQCDPAEVWYGRGFADWLDKTGRGMVPLNYPPVKQWRILAGDDAYGTAISDSFEEAITGSGLGSNYKGVHHPWFYHRLGSRPIYSEGQSAQCLFLYRLQSGGRRGPGPTACRRSHSLPGLYAIRPFRT